MNIARWSLVSRAAVAASQALRDRGTRVVILGAMGLLPLMTPMVQTAHAVDATGGDIVTNYPLNGTNFIVHIFTTVGATNLTITTGGDIEVLVVAGGGGGASGGGSGSGGGGGAGGLVYTSLYAVATGSVSITVGGGGPGGPNVGEDRSGTNGADSVFGSITAKGGGGGGAYKSKAGKLGGSGGGGGSGNAATFGVTSGNGTNNQGKAGGTGVLTSATAGGGGGGGYGTVGTNGTNTAGGTGGSGGAFNISGTNLFYAGGGGGGRTNSAGAGGSGVGGPGGNYATGGAGTNGRGGGGGGGGGPNLGGNGGSGVVIIRYALQDAVFAVEALPASGVTTNSATLNGVLPDGHTAGNADVFFCWSYTNAGTNSLDDWDWHSQIATNWGVGSNFTSAVTGLLSGSNYFYRAFASNSTGSAWSDAQSFTTIQFAVVTVTNTDGSAMAPPDGASDTGILTIQRDPAATDQDLTVTYAWSGTAIEGEDYILSPAGTSVTLPIGVAETNITVIPLLNPSILAEPGRTLWLTLQAGGYGIGTPASNVVTVQRYVFTPGANVSITNGDWTNGAIWSLGRRPLSGDSVTITNSVTLSESTYYLNSLTITNATLTFTNWMTQLRVLTDVTVLKNGKLTCAGPFFDEQMTNRVWVSCSNLTLAAGSLGIDVATKGYAGGYGTTYSGQGPGAGTTHRGGGYGGVGGSSGGAPYGSTNAPTDPGSGGGGAFNGGVSRYGGAGGGAVWIQATGAVTADGPINANGGTRPSTYGGGGSGGSILIECNTFAGTNLLSAAGGMGQSFSAAGGNGGGGRIAVLYNPAAQSLLPLPSSTFSTSMGIGGDLAFGGVGTLYFPDTRLLTETIRHTGQLFIPGFTNWAPDSLTISNALIRFQPNGFQLAVASNLVITGVGTGANNYQGLQLFGGSLSCGGGASVKGATLTLGRFNADGPQFDCGGSLMLTNGAVLRVYGAETNELTEDYGAFVRVPGTFAIASNAWVYPYSDTTNGGSPFFQVGNLTVDAGGGFNAFALGYAAGYGGAVATRNGYGPGGGRYTDGGGAHGGLGGRVSGGIYGSSNAPVQPGSGGGGSYPGTVTMYGGPGGGVVRVLASGTVTVNGTITVNGSSKLSDYGGGGAGGSIYLYCQRFSGTGGILTANGGSSLAYPGTNPGGGGGGGRISIQRVTDTSGGGVLAYVEGGQDGLGSKNGGDGTIVWGRLPFPGSMFSIR